MSLHAPACPRTGPDASGQQQVRRGDSQLPGLAEAGVTELVLVASPPADASEISGWVADLAGRWMTARP
jgi:hypothetical protein